ncbi:TRAP transporter large permease subunit [Pusillimonas sp. ANT_WB101]|uniref:TRAP transporter large permease subunit n=1 Tax=Pusillimonas sp. ANT_WB101 TaxID=2597356 RepID=UPI0011EBB003|nr:TRAP transporter large permease subunit [Pusillimonas sp. ANT_WB101]KAA0892519.1 TRAP transporter large permease subunit [Pusillimonas sp. ANT_WB101]
MMSGDITAYSLPARAICRASTFLNYLAILGVIATLAATNFDVFSRYLFDAPTSWATEISTYALVVGIFCGAAHTHLKEGNVRVDLLLMWVSPANRRVILLIAAWAALVFTLIASWQSFLLVLSDYKNGSRLLGLLLTPSWLPKLPIAVGLLVLSGALLVEIERVAQYAAGFRRSFPYLLMLVLAVVLVGLGVKPPLLPGTRFDFGSLAIVLAVVIGASSNGPKVLLGVGVMLVGGWAAMYLGKHQGVGFVTLMMGLVIVGMLAAGVRIAFVLGLVGILSIYFLTPIPFPVNIPGRIWNSTSSFALIAVPMFVLMGAVLMRSGLSRELFAVMARCLSWLPGGLAHASMAGCGIFAAVSGSSVATAATIGGVACPEMTQRGYHPGLTYGAVAAGGTLGILIPPSVPMIIYGMTVGVPITAMFIAGIVPGILMMLCFTLVTIGWALIMPSAAPRTSAVQAPLTRASYIDTLLLLLLLVLVIAALYAGLATPSETGAVGAFIALIICAVRGRMTLHRFLDAVAETVVVTSFIFLIVAGAHILTFGFDYLKISQSLMASATEGSLGRWQIMLIILLVYVVLGMFLDSISMLVLTLPIVFPLIVSLGFDPLWFGVIVVIAAEIGLVTPPVGMNLFVLQGISRDVSIRTIALGTAPYVVAMFVAIALLCVFPEIAIWLTRHMK